MSDCLLRWYAELLSANVSLNEICLGVTGDGFNGVRADGARFKPSGAVMIGVGFSRAAARCVCSLVFCCAGWLSAICRDREFWRETWGGEGAS